MITATKDVIPVFLLAILLHCVLGSEWGYDEEDDGSPSQWYKSFPECSGKYQSPIDIIPKRAWVDYNLHTLQLPGYTQRLSNCIVVNNGHTVQLNFPTDKTFALTGGGLEPSTYKAVQLHFHWSAPGSTNGSEHSIDGKRYPVEMHIVHIKEPYNTTDQVKKMADGLAVVSVMFKLSQFRNMHLQKVLDAAEKLTYAGSSTTLYDGPTLISLLPDSGTFYRYFGSLTTPPCYETVVWSLFAEPALISQSQLLAFQRLKSVQPTETTKVFNLLNAKNQKHSYTQYKDSMGGNYRPLQAEDGRVITSFMDYNYKKIDQDYWTYHGRLTGTTQWSSNYASCGKVKQSPINIKLATISKPILLENLQFTRYNEEMEGHFVNNGHTVQLNFDSRLKYEVTGGGLESSYTALQLHIHWGEVLPQGIINGGSEHVIDGKRYPAEMHIVHGKTSHLTNLIEYRKTASDAYLVLSVFIDVYRNKTEDDDDRVNKDFNILIETIGNIPFAGETTDLLVGPQLSSLLPVDKTFFRYNGSLTTPPCTESVIWTVFKEPIKLSFNQFAVMGGLFSSKKAGVGERYSIKKMKVSARTGNCSEPLFENGTAEHLLRNNFRPLQGVHNRRITIYEITNENSTADIPSFPMIGLIISCGIVIVIVILMAIKRCWGNTSGASFAYMGPRNTSGALPATQL